LVLGLWAVGPIILGLLSIASKNEDLFVKYMVAHPLLQTQLVMAGAAGSQNAHLTSSTLEYGSEHKIFGGSGGIFDFGEMTAALLITAGIYILAGLLFFWRAKCRLRRKIV
jgi:hypothetical protein